MLKMAASCCPPTAIFPLPRSRARYRMVSSNSAIQPLHIQEGGRSQWQLGRRVGLSFRVPMKLETRRSVRVSCIGDNNKIVTGKSWDKLILNSDIPVLVEFYASSCGPCRMVHRVIEEIATDYLGRLKCFVLNADHDPKIAEGYDIKAVPVVLLFKKGERHDSVMGTMPKEFYVAAIERVLSS